MEAVKVMAREIVRKMYNGPDWEQRRYEVARDLFSAIVSNSGKTDAENLRTQAFVAVVGADMLIKELVELPLPEYYGKKGK